MIEKLLKMIGEKYPLTEKDTDGFTQLKAKGMKFDVKAYGAEGLGHVSVMRAKGFFGLMKMDTLIVNPDAVDLPLYSYDRILAMGNDTLIAELYDTVLEPFDAAGLEKIKEKYADLPERDPGTHWYDSIRLAQSLSKKGKKKDGRFDALAEEHFSAYLDAPAGATADPAAKREKASVYVEGLLKNGGPSTDVFKKTIGVEKTAELFRKVLFGTE